MQTEKTQFQNNTGSYVGVSIFTGKGEAKGISVEPHGKVWLSPEEQAITAQAPRRAEDNPFDPRSGERFGLEAGTAILTICQESRVIGSERFVPAEASAVQDIAHAKAAATGAEPVAVKPATPVAAQAAAAAFEKRAADDPRVTPDDADPVAAADIIREGATPPPVATADPDAAPEPVVEPVPEPTPVTPEPPTPSATVPATDPVATSGLPTAPVPPEVAAGQDPAAREAEAAAQATPPAEVTGEAQHPATHPEQGAPAVEETTAAQEGETPVNEGFKREGAEEAAAEVAAAQETVGTPGAQQSGEELQAAAPASAEVSGALEDVGTPEAQQGDTAQQGDDPFPQAD